MTIHAGWKAEIRKVFFVTLFFFICFVFFTGLKKAILAEYDIPYYMLGKSAVAALVMGKVVVLTSKLSLIRLFDEHAKVYTVVFRSLIYLLAFMVFLFLEMVFKHLVFDEPFSKGLQRMQSIAFGVEISIYFLLFMMLNALLEIRRFVGPGALYRLFFTNNPPERPQNEGSGH